MRPTLGESKEYLQEEEEKRQQTHFGELFPQGDGGASLFTVTEATITTATRHVESGGNAHWCGLPGAVG